MGRLLLARGSRGALVEKVQKGLGFEPRDLDGVFGGQTEDSVRDFQTRTGQSATGQVDSDTWTGITNLPIPGLFDRALQITADFEGHGFTLAQGNFDGAGITWGIIGFTLKGGELSGIVLEMNRDRPDLVRTAFAELTPKLLQVMKAPFDRQLEFADSVSIAPGKARLAEPWRSSFALFGAIEEVQQLQLRRAREKYFEPAVNTAGRLQLKTEIGVALSFDIHVQNGGVKRAIESALISQPFGSEKKLRVALANAVADSSKPKFREDVRSRKVTLATGTGTVHGTRFTVAHWGLDETQAT